MIELTEALVLSRQINQVCLNKKIIRVLVNQNPHKWAWFNGDPNQYESMLLNRSFKYAKSFGGMLEIDCDDCHLVFTDGVQLSYRTILEPEMKHQLLLEFKDHTYFIVSVRMYGGIWCYTDVFDNPYYFIAKKKPSVFSDDFNIAYFNTLVRENNEGLSLKAFLATEQRIPGFGNGLCQDVLWKAKLHPKMKLKQVSSTQIEVLFNSIKSMLEDIVSHGGRDTEHDLLGEKGRYLTKMSQSGLKEGCPECGSLIVKENYLGGSIYTCPKCQVKPEAK
jgi:formamidopyrimidine-DNA glycosylase